MVIGDMPPPEPLRLPRGPFCMPLRTSSKPMVASDLSQSTRQNWPSCAPRSMDREGDLIHRQQHFYDDQADDVPFQAHATLVLHQLKHDADRLTDQSELAVDRPAAFEQFVFVLQTRIGPL